MMGNTGFRRCGYILLMLESILHYYSLVFVLCEFTVSCLCMCVCCAFVMGLFVWIVCVVDGSE